MRNSTFRFKQFDCDHGNSSIKIGVDAVLLGAWASVDNARTILDVGCGCGVIALMCAQRNAVATVSGIDVDSGSVQEASFNFNRCPWAERLRAIQCDFNDWETPGLDLIVSNPPYFESGVLNPESVRLVARHQAGLSPAVLINRGKHFLSPQGRISMIVPADQFDDMNECGRLAGLPLIRANWIRGHMNAPVKRALLEFGVHGRPVRKDSIDTLTLEVEPGTPTQQHISLCKDFYLKF